MAALIDNILSITYMTTYCQLAYVMGEGVLDRRKNEELSRLVWDILQAGNRLVEAGNRLSAPFGLTAARWQVMGVIVQEPATVADVARRLSQTRQNVQRLADDMVRVGLVAYHPNPRHARAKLLAPTAQGADAYRRLMKAQAKWIDALSATMPAEDVKTTRALLAALGSALESNGD